MSDAFELLPAGTAPALEGYFYQLDVSILIALEVVMARQLASSVVLEPIASKEDLELDLLDEPQLLAESAVLETYRLVIQCKLKNTGPWKVTELETLLKHGTRRKSAAKRLADERVRYMLITNADLDGIARRLRITELGTWPDEPLPANLATVLPGTAAGRVAVLPVMDNEKLTARVKSLLTERFRVPQANLAACRLDLHEQALLRMRGAASGQWTREDLDRLIIKSGGFSGQAEALEGFVRPKNWEQLRGILSTQHAIILTGPSGTGKTRTAQALIASLRDEVKGTAVSVVRGGPEKIDQEQRRPVVFDIEDPWGRYQSEPEAIAWNDSIHSLLNSARPERKFVFTSRSDVLADSGPKCVRARFIARLEPEHYGESERARLISHRLARLPARLQKLAVEHWREALSELATPLEIERYLDALSGGACEGEHEHDYFRRCLEEAHQGSIEHSILFNVRHRHAYRWAAVLWGLFKAQPAQTFTTLPLVQAALTQKDLAFEDGLGSYINFLVAGHNLRQSGPHLAYQHPRVELGLQQAMQEKPELSARTLLTLLRVLIDLGKVGHLEWGRDGAVRLVAAARRLQGVTVNVGASEQAELDDWLLTRLASPGANFQDDLHLAAEVGSTRCVVAEVARWLINRSDVDGLDIGWRPKKLTPEWIETVRAQPATSIVCAAFVRRVLARDHGYYRKNFAYEIRQLAPDLGQAFRDAAMDNVEYGYTSNDDAIAWGALEDLDAFEPILAKCLDHMKELRANDFDDEWLGIRDGHHSDEAAEHFEQSLGEQGHTAGEFVQAYVTARRERDGWTALRDHPRRASLLSAWIRVVRDDANASDAEWSALGTSTKDTECESQFWEEALSRWSPALARMARTRLIEGGADEAGQLALATVLARHLAAEIAGVARELLHRGVEDVLQLACDLANAQREDVNDAAIAAAIERVASAVPSPLDQAVRQGTISASASTSAPGTTTLTWRTLNPGSSRRLRLARARILAAAGDDVAGEVEQLLNPIRDSEAEIRFAAAVFEVAIQANLAEVIENGLNHRFADVRLRALQALSQGSGTLPPQALACAADKSHNVRAALLGFLKARPHVEHTEALIVLAADRWTPDVHWAEQLMQYPIAEGAAEILGRPPTLDEAQCMQIMAIALRIESERVTLALFVALVINGTANARASVLTAALEGDTALIRRLAARALAANAECLESTLVARVMDEHLTKGQARAAFALTLLVGARANLAQARRAAKAIAAVPAAEPCWFRSTLRSKGAMWKPPKKRLLCCLTRSRAHWNKRSRTLRRSLGRHWCL